MIQWSEVIQQQSEVLLRVIDAFKGFALTTAQKVEAFNVLQCLLSTALEGTTAGRYTNPVVLVCKWNQQSYLVELESFLTQTCMLVHDSSKQRNAEALKDFRKLTRQISSLLSSTLEHGASTRDTSLCLATLQRVIRLAVRIITHNRYKVHMVLVEDTLHHTCRYLTPLSAVIHQRHMGLHIDAQFLATLVHVPKSPGSPPGGLGVKVDLTETPTETLADWYAMMKHYAKGATSTGSGVEIDSVQIPNVSTAQNVLNQVLGLENLPNVLTIEPTAEYPSASSTGPVLSESGAYLRSLQSLCERDILATPVTEIPAQAECLGLSTYPSQPVFPGMLDEGFMMDQCSAPVNGPTVPVFIDTQPSTCAATDVGKKTLKSKRSRHKQKSPSRKLTGKDNLSPMKLPNSHPFGKKKKVPTATLR